GDLIPTGEGRLELNRDGVVVWRLNCWQGIRGAIVEGFAALEVVDHVDWIDVRRLGHVEFDGERDVLGGQRLAITEFYVLAQVVGILGGIWRNRPFLDHARVDDQTTTKVDEPAVG